MNADALETMDALIQLVSFRLGSESVRYRYIESSGDKENGPDHQSASGSYLL